MSPGPRHDDRARLLGRPVRRTALAVLRDVGEPIGLSALAERIVEREQYTIDVESYESQCEETAISLHHDHLPALSDGGLVGYDVAEQTVRLREDRVTEPEWVGPRR